MYTSKGIEIDENWITVSDFSDMEPGKEMESVCSYHRRYLDNPNNPLADFLSRN